MRNHQAPSTKSQTNLKIENSIFQTLFGSWSLVLGTSQQGIVSIATTMIIFAVTLIIAVSVQYIGVGELLMGYGEQQSEQAFQLADSCADEALLRLKRNSAYTGGSLSAGSASCTITVSGSGSTRTVNVTATAGDSVRKLTIGVSIVGAAVTITSWSEVTT